VRILSLQLRNYRVYRELDLELPGGVVGVYGANGSGKSSLLESIMWVLYGKARTQKQQIPSSGVQQGGTGVECSVVLVFEHEGHHYTVKRSISGTAFTVKARVTLGDQVAADGPTDVDRYMQSVLGMDASAFKASVFAEQKQLAAFSDQAPDKRRQMVLQLLGITPVERARDKARSVAKELQTQLDRATPLLASVADAEAKLVGTQAALAQSLDEDAVATEALEKCLSMLRQARAAVDSLQDSKAADALIREKGNAVKRRKDDATVQLEALSRELAAANAEQVALAELELSLVDIDQLEQRAGHFKTIRSARQRLAKLPPPVDVEVGDESVLTKARSARDELSAELAGLVGEVRGAQERVRIAAESAAQTAGLDGADGCPLCGQALGAGVEQMRAHRREEVQSAETALRRLMAIQAKLKPRLAEASEEVAKLERSDATAAKQRAEQATASATRDAQLHILREGVDLVGGVEPSDADIVAFEKSLSAAKANLSTATTIRARLERIPALVATQQRLIDSLAELAQERNDLLLQLKSLNFDASRFNDLLSSIESAEKQVEIARARTTSTGRAVATQQALSAAAIEALEHVQGQHAQLADQRAQAAILLRTASLLHEFRQYIVGLVGPQLQIQASSLFNQLTANEYDGLDVDPETYELRIVDHGTAHPLARFSGSEVDLANLALRVAISEQVRFQAGGQVGLLVLDEALSSLDAERKDRTLGSLAQLGGRFQQILVVTHSPEVKEQLPSAIEVIRTSGRQSTARVIEAGA
jgi:DNA repair protein SbcC/Rad50